MRNALALQYLFDGLARLDNDARDIFPLGGFLAHLIGLVFLVPVGVEGDYLSRLPSRLAHVLCAEHR